MDGIEIQNVTKRVKLPDGKKETIFENFNMNVGEKEIVGIFGPNGCGKTTLLNMVSGILKPDSGEIFILGKKPSDNNIAYIFQDYRSSLFPWLSIKDNILFPLSIKKIKKSEMNKNLEYLIDLVKLPFSMNKYPYQLSGGQQQYVSIMRCLISNPGIMLVDEPFSALDYSNTMWLMEKMSLIFDTIKIPTLIVAHDLEHLVYLTEKICFFSDKPAKVVREQNGFLNITKDKGNFNYREIKEMKLEIQKYYSKKEDYSGWNQI
jgi:NitT/TauT family transport system ATP-binding protein